jgi:MerR family transcriptional regulator, light-induced transcriptional regulator
MKMNADVEDAMRQDSARLDRQDDAPPLPAIDRVTGNTGHDHRLLRLQESFLALLEAEDREGCIRFALDGLDSGEFTVPELYEKIAGPSLSQSETCSLDNDGCIWHEHVKTAIVRTVVENCWTRVMDASRLVEARNETAMVLCPEKELHELGARMVADFFTLHGYKSVFVGANTPREQIRAAVVSERPAVLAVSVTDFFNLVEAGKAIARLRDTLSSQGLSETRILVGGHAFSENPDMVRQIRADGLLKTFADIGSLPKAGTGSLPSGGTGSLQKSDTGSLSDKVLKPDSASASDEESNGTSGRGGGA